MNCLHPLWLKNPYTGKYVSVSCRECECCKVQLANSFAERIRNELEFVASDFKTYFVTLTYGNEYIPYIHLKEQRFGLDSLGLPSVFRGCTHPVEITDFYSDNADSSGDIADDFLCRKSFHASQVFFIQDIAPDAVGVIYFKDFQDFTKRLNKCLAKKYNYGYGAFKYCVSSEYGETTYRPHFHVLITTKVPEEILKAAIMQSWTYCLYDELERWFEIAIKPAAYLSTYICDGFGLPDFYKYSVWRQKKSHSLHYGFARPEFDLPNFFRSAYERVYTYHKEYISKTRGKVEYDIPFPSYVRNRYFPYFAWITRLSMHEFIYLCETITRLDERPFDFLSVRIPETRYGNAKRFDLILSNYDFSITEIFYKLKDFVFDSKRVYLACERMRYYASLLGISFKDYLFTYYNFYVGYKSYLIKQSHESDLDFSDSFSVYDNLSIGAPDYYFIDEFGEFRKSEVTHVLLSSSLSYLQRRLLSSYHHNKIIKKFKSKTIDYYHIKYGTS